MSHLILKISGSSCDNTIGRCSSSCSDTTHSSPIEAAAPQVLYTGKALVVPMDNQPIAHTIWSHTIKLLSFIENKKTRAQINDKPLMTNDDDDIETIVLDFSSFQCQNVCSLVPWN